MSERNVSSTPQENFSFLITEILGRSDDQKKSTGEIIRAVNALDKKLENLAPAIKEILSEYFKQLEQLIDKKIFVLQHANKPTNIAEMKSVVVAKEKPVIKKIQILLFPEQDAKLFYKIVFGRWFLMLVIALFLQICYRLFSQQQEINKQIKMEALKSDPIIKAWNYLYDQKNKTLHKQMDSALVRSAGTGE